MKFLLVTFKESPSKAMLMVIGILGKQHSFVWTPENQVTSLDI